MDNHLKLWYEEENCLYNYLEKVPGYPCIRPLPSEYPQHLCPLLPGVPQVSHNRWTVTIHRREDTEKIIEGRNIGDQESIWPENLICDRPGLLCRQPTPLPLRYLGTIRVVGMADVHGQPQQQNVTAGALKVGEVALLHDDYCAPQTVVKKMDRREILVLCLEYLVTSSTTRNAGSYVIPFYWRVKESFIYSSIGQSYTMILWRRCSLTCHNQREILFGSPPLLMHIMCRTR